MPPLTSEQQDAVQEAISRQLYRINNYIKGMFGHDMDDERILRAHRNITQGVNTSMRQLEQQKQTPGTYQGLPPGGGSRIVGDVPIGGGDVTFQNPVMRPGTAQPMDLKLNPADITDFGYPPT